MTGCSDVVILQGDARSLPLPDECVDLILTSPPYFGLRSYTDDGEHYPGQIGSERTPQEYLDNLLACTREWVRILKPQGSIFVNLGDKFSQRTQTRRSSHQPGIFPGKFPEFGESWRERRENGATRMPWQNVIGDGYIREKSLMGLPWRYAIGCMDKLGLILRAEIIWSKPNGLPESVTDRVRKSHEQVFHFTRRQRYFSGVDEIREPHIKQNWENRSSYAPGSSSGYTNGKRPAKSDAGLPLNPLGKLPGSVWSIPSCPLKVPAELEADHFAAFPPELCRRIILGWSPGKVCLECGEGRKPLVTAEYDTQGRTTNGPQSIARRHESPGREVRAVRATRITGYACACPDDSAPASPGIVLDPFGGTGTTAMTASVLGRRGITVDMSFDYCRIARWRVNDPKQRAKVLKEKAPLPARDAQPSLFGDGYD
jgi:DNA modification methylase